MINFFPQYPLPYIISRQSRQGRWRCSLFTSSRVHHFVKADFSKLKQYGTGVTFNRTIFLPNSVKIAQMLEKVLQ